VNAGPTGTGETTYSFDAGPVHIAAINEYWDGGTSAGSDVARDGDVVAELRDWLAADLAASSAPWKIVFGHEPAYPQPDEDWGDARHVGNSLDKYPANRDAFWDLLEANGVVAYICGHTHRASHYQPTTSSVWQIDVGEARGIGKYGTFLIVEADYTEITFNLYRSLDSAQFALTDSWAVPEPATVVLLLPAAVALLARRMRRAG
jgi:hypothetical protein